MAGDGKITISIDRGGTFTDVHAIVPGKPDIILKLLSVDPAHYQDAPTEGVRQILELVTGEPHPRGQPLKLDRIGSLRMGTTVATNALLERKGARSVLLTTKGFRDLLKIGDQSRPNIFDLSMARPGVLPEGVVEVNERIVPCHPSADKDCFAGARIVEGVTGEKFRVVQELNLEEVRSELQRYKDQGYQSLSVALVHSFAYPEHERQIGELAESMGFSVTLSSKLQPMIKIVPRGMSAAADAYLTPVIKTYIDSISSSFEGGLERQHECRFEFMQSDGGLVDFRRFSGLKAILSGPAAGVVGFAATSWDPIEKTPVIGFDMGGTSTDVSRFDGHLEHVFGSKVAGVLIQSPQLDINTVAAGGGSILSYRNGLFYVGPESASAHPGPACYRKGGPLTVTDANLFLGRLLPEYFPHIFGPNEDQPLDIEVTTKLFHELTQKINAERKEKGQPEYAPEEVALGFLKVADESMARPIRNLTQARGFETASHHLACFGGAGGQHACSVAASLGISRIIIHKYSSVLSAYGLALAEVVKESQEPVSADFETSQSSLEKRFNDMTDNATAEMNTQGFPADQVRHELYLNMRYEGSDTSLMILKPEDDSGFLEQFKTRHRREFNFNSDRAVLVDDIRVRTIASSKVRTEKSPLVQLREATLQDVTGTPDSTTSAYFDGYSSRINTPVYLLDKLQKNARVHGPAVIIDKTQTIVVAPNSVAKVLDTCIVIDLKEEQTAANGVPSELPSEIDPIRLSIFGHRFMSIAEQMGRTLQKTSVSTNIKERLDFSCALFSPDGGLVANAPHVPVHLGSMQFAVRYQHEKWLGNLRDGDVLVANHPSCGGTHLPDITVITPVFDRPGGSEIMFYVASRGHHADIGGILPGSMPPKSTELWQEGAAIEGEKIVSNGVFEEERIIDLLVNKPAQHPGCSGSRCLSDNLSDLKAQIAANTRGIALIQSLFAEYGVETVQKYMYAIQATAETAVRNLLKDLHKRFNGEPLEAVDYMDDGTPIRLKVTINESDGSAVFDFSGTGPEVYGGWNAPIAITHSAIIYCLRAMIASDVPLNQGCLAPIDIQVPSPSILSPTKTAAVVGGNVVTSQRITDVVLKAFRACAASQGCCNNLTFGTNSKVDPDTGATIPGFGYYETIAGGSGAGPTWKGESGIHVHMTNTRITDPEILEKRYPTLLRQFTLRPGSGGKGLHPGGDGVIRDIEFLAPMECSILSERRVHRPYGLEGGEDAQSGLNLWISKDEETGEERVVNIGGKNTVSMKTHNRVVIMTAGGGGWGAA
ncbi:Hydantoinase B/oxoprolinase-domain-containing protein [Aspergillus pseudonomiae]|uniref:Hydantoinase B/oxoprolinase-domain-containing protein n=1 Tax=Aspergillus pseudonomiae TaxID=1506151 RepID=A0A5N7D737_9EURO|nr:Hydantoinase B/oxoprolinase-domain-containing protein [Aspergillus pseudonomiae]KAB8254108.1 Hydantoinase B/oxoprolinase-domain-containing protein [Aspergillus pseudonomiae]KAE8402089.1 Hydantoinase B/oxoprolinase-domain-containing protein [Aspergillus pseudonomiae]